MSNILLVICHVFIIICVVLAEKTIIQNGIFKRTWKELEGLHFTIIVNFILFMIMAVATLIYIQNDSPHVYFSVVRAVFSSIIPIHFTVSRFKTK